MERSAERIVDLGRERCPFCHDEVEVERAVVCQACLARHHDGCWDEGGRCSSCGELERLVPKGRATLTPALARQTLVAAGYPEEEVERVLHSPSPNPDPFRQPRGMPFGACFKVEVLAEGELLLTWDHHASGTKWLSRAMALLLLPMAFLVPTLWSKEGGSLKLGREALEVRGLFGRQTVMGAPQVRSYARDQPLKLALAGLGGVRASVSFFDGEQVLYLLGSEGTMRGLEPLHATWLLDLLLAWQRDELEAWLPHLR